jgi:hypothetical protein
MKLRISDFESRIVGPARAADSVTAFLNPQSAVRDPQ